MNISYKNWFLPPDLSTHGYQIDNLIRTIVIRRTQLNLLVVWSKP